MLNHVLFRILARIQHFFLNKRTLIQFVVCVFKSMILVKTARWVKSQLEAFYGEMKKKIIGKIISIGQMICPMVFSHARLFVWVVRKFSFITGVRGVPRSNDRSLLCDLIRQQSLKCASSLETCVLSHHLLVSGTINIGTSVSCLIFQLC